ncbi:MAG: glycosyltransferase [Nanoarchaeota archaeon]
MEKNKVSVVIPVYKPEKKVFDKLKKNLRNQTIPVEIIEKWNNPEAVSMNLGIKEAKGEIIVILAQDCIPKDKNYIEKLIKPLQDKNVSAVVSDLLLPEYYWKKRSFFMKMFSIHDLKLKKPRMNLSSCSYRKKDLEKIGLINEKVSAIDLDFVFKIKKIGKIKRGNVIVYHLHNYKSYKKMLETFYNYYKFNGISIRNKETRNWGFLKKIIRATPFLGFASIYYRYPLKKYFYLLPLHFVSAGVIEHIINVIGFWHGFIIKEDEGSRNKEVLNENKVDN